MQPHFDFAINVPTILSFLTLGGTLLIKIVSFINRIEYKVNIMWDQFLVEHPEYERREIIRARG